MARRLNTLLHGLRLRANAVMTTKHQLAALFRAEIDRMHGHLDDLALMARRFGNADDPSQLESDLEVGWAYRLLQLFGSRKPLSFADGCPGRSLLLRNGIPEAHIGNIAAIFLSEQQGMRTGVFEEQVKARMAEFGIDDTVLNRERALTEILRAQGRRPARCRRAISDGGPGRTAFTRTPQPPAEACTHGVAPPDASNGQGDVQSSTARLREADALEGLEKGLAADVLPRRVEEEGSREEGAPPATELPGEGRPQEESERAAALPVEARRAGDEPATTEGAEAAAVVTEQEAAGDAEGAESRTAPIQALWHG